MPPRCEQPFALFVPQQLVVRHRAQRLADAATSALASSLANQRAASRKAELFGRLCGLWRPIEPDVAVIVVRVLGAVEEAIGRQVRPGEWTGEMEAPCLVPAPLAMHVLTKVRDATIFPWLNPAPCIFQLHFSTKAWS